MAAEAQPDDILKLYNSEGHLMNISHRLAANNPHSRYELNVVGACHHGICASFSFQGRTSAGAEGIGHVTFCHVVFGHKAHCHKSFGHTSFVTLHYVP